jgi:hypothetical protein
LRKSRFPKVAVTVTISPSYISRDGVFVIILYA